MMCDPFQILAAAVLRTCTAYRTRRCGLRFSLPRVFIASPITLHSVGVLGDAVNLTGLSPLSAAMTSLNKCVCLPQQASTAAKCTTCGSIIFVKYAVS